MLLNHCFLSLSLNTSILWYLLFLCMLTFLVFLFFFRFPSCLLPGVPSLFVYCDSLGNSYSSKGLMRPQLLFLGSIPNVFKWEKLGFKCKVFLWKLFFFPFEKHSERQICSPLLTKKQSVSQETCCRHCPAGCSLPDFWDSMHELLRKSWEWVSGNSVLTAFTQGKL